MKKVLLVVLLIVVIIAVVFCAIKFTNKPDATNQVNIIDNENVVDLTNPDITSKIEVGTKTLINQIDMVPIGDGDDFVIITDNVKWDAPEHEQGTTVSFSIAVPYTIHVDGVDYEGTYYLGDTDNTEDNLDKNTKYNFSIVDIKDNYETEVLITEK